MNLLRVYTLIGGLLAFLVAGCGGGGSGGVAEVSDDGGDDVDDGGGTPPAPQNQSPTVLSQTATAFLNSMQTLTLQGNDPDGDDLTFSVLDSPINGSLGPLDNSRVDSATVSYTPNPGFLGDDSFAFLTNDGEVDSNIATFTVTVLATAQGTVYYVATDDPNASDSNPGTDEAFPFKTIQRAADEVEAGDVVLIKAGMYVHSPDNPSNREFVTVNTSGRADAPILFAALGDGPVVLQGWGFVDAEFDHDPNAGPLVNTNEILFHIPHGTDYIHVRGLELANSSRWGVVVAGSFNRIENCESHDNWNIGFLIGSGQPVEGNVLIHLETYRNRHHTAIEMSENSYNNRIQNCLAYNNGRKPDGEKVFPINGDPAGGGNSDGIGVFKACHDIAPPGENLCTGNVIEGNVVFGNADDGIDVSFADSQVIGNISFDNGPEGQRGFKVLRYVKNLTFARNIAFDNFGPGFELRNAGGGKYYNNLAISNGWHGFSIWPDSLFHNNLGLNNNGESFRGSGCADCVVTHNWDGDLQGDPQLVNPNPVIDTDFPVGLSIAEKVDFIKDQFRAHFSLQPSSPCIDGGTVIPGFTDEFNGSAPDIGPFESIQ